MNEQEVLNKLSTVFSDVFDDDIELESTMTADDIDEWDSLSHLRLMVSIEEEFDVEFSPLEVEGLKNVGELAQAISKKIR